MQDLPGYSEACKVLEKNLSSRAKRLANLERYVEGTQYNGLPDWFSDEVPLWERAPCIVYPIVKSAIDSNADLLLGEGRYPSVTVEGLSGDQAETFEQATERVSQQARLRAGAREAFDAGQGCGTACATFGVRGGRLFIDTLLARWCEPKLALDGSVVSLEIRYPYLTTVTDSNGPKVVCKIYRRTLDAQDDILYAPALAHADAREPSWSVASVTTHGLGYCPAVWYSHMRGCAADEEIDGHAIHENLTDEIRAHDFSLSQRHRAALYAGDPQWTEIGVEKGYNPTGAGRRAEVPASAMGRPGDSPTSSYVSNTTSTGKARKKSPGTIWQYPGKNPEVKVELHTLPGDALTAIDNHAKDLRRKLAESLGVVFLDVESLPRESRLSGRALESFKAPQLNRIDYYRADFGDRFLRPALGMLLRIALDTGVQIKGLDVVKTSIAAIPAWSWHAPSFEFVWGDYFRPSGEEEELIIRGACEMLTAGFATKRIIVEKLRSILGVKDIDSYMTELEAEQAQVMEQQRQMVEAEAKAKASAKPAPAAAGAKK